MNKMLISALLMVLMLSVGCSGGSGVNLGANDASAVTGDSDLISSADETGGEDSAIVPDGDAGGSLTEESAGGIDSGTGSADAGGGGTGAALEVDDSMSSVEDATVAADDETVSEEPPQDEAIVSDPEPVAPQPIHEFDLSLDRSRAALDEGNTGGTTFVASVNPHGGEPVQLSVRPVSETDGENVLVNLSSEQLDANVRQANVTFRFPVGMRPVLPQTRLFRLVARSGDVEKVSEIALDVKPTTAPDVYLLIGQSNMVGSSETGAKDISPGGLDQRNARIKQLNVQPNNNRIFSSLADFISESKTAISPPYIEAEDPLHDPRSAVVGQKGGTSIGPALSFAKAALNDTSATIYLVPAAWGASGFCNVAGRQLAWNAGETNNAALGGSGLLERAMTRLRMVLRDTGGVFRGILWHQGGADSNSQACADAYAENLRRMVERIRREAPQDARGQGARGPQAPIPFIVATQSKGSDSRGNYSRWPWTKAAVDAVHRNVSTIVPYADWVNTDDLVPPAYPCGTSSCVHFGALANREIGRRYYEALKRIWNR